MKTFLIFLALSAAGSCSAAFQDWDPVHQQQFKTHLLLQTIDTYQTIKMIDCQKIQGCYLKERNPFLPEKPSKGRLIAQKLAGNYLLYKFTDKSSPSQRDKRIKALVIFGTLVVLNNGFYLETRF
jgi:hypothetical protein